MTFRSSLARNLLIASLIVACSPDRVFSPRTPDAPSLPTHVVAGVPDLVITEIMADPAKVADGSGEWFEIYNGGSTVVDLNGYRISSFSGENHTISACLLVGPGGYAVVGNNINTATNGGVSVKYSYGTSITLNNSNTDWLTLKTPSLALVDSVSYSTRSGGTVVAPSTSPTSGASFVVGNASGNNTIVAGNANWSVTPTGTTYGLGDRGTPGNGSYAIFGGGSITAGVTVSPATATPGIGNTRQFCAVQVNGSGSVVPTTFTWSTSDASIATVSSSGLATAVGQGTATITATASDGTSASGAIEVAPPAVGTITLSINVPRKIPVGFVKPVFATVRDASGAIISPQPALTWSSSDPAKASVDQSGYVTGHVVTYPDSVTITATAANGVSGSRRLAVTPATVPTTSVYYNHLEFGTPTDGDLSGEIINVRQEFAYGYSPQRGGPKWVGWNLNGTQFGDSLRCDCFSPDNALPAGVYRVVDSDYRNGGYDRGHMVQSESRTVTDQENAATFLLTNILPQAGDNNQGPWLAFENFLNNIARNEGKQVYVVAGGEYSASPSTLKDEGKVAIPDYTWKVAIVLGSGRTRLADVDSYDDLVVYAARFPNLTTPGVPASAVGIRNLPWTNFETSVDAIEAAVGLDLFSALPDPLEAIIESRDKPPVAHAGGPYSGAEGSSIAFNGTASFDPDGDAITYHWEFGDGATGSGAQPTHVYADNGTYQVKLTVSDPVGASSSTTVTVVVSNAAPEISSLTAPGGPIVVGALSGYSVGYSDAGAADTHTATFAWGDGTSTTVGGSAGSASASHAYASAGLYYVTVTVTDDDGASDTGITQTYLVVVDRAPFVTGGGWIQPSASRGNTKATFGLDARYDGVTATGNVEVNFHDTGARFHSSAIDWIVVSGDRATIRARGSLSGHSGTAVLTITVIDGAGPRSDRARIRVVAPDGTVFFDSNPGAADHSSTSVALGGGNATIHR